MTIDQYLAANGPTLGEPALHKAQSRVSRKQWAKLIASQAAADAAAVERREELRAEYAAKVAAGELRPPTRRERLEATAAGHPDNPSTQAARRILAELA